MATCPTCHLSTEPRDGFGASSEHTHREVGPVGFQAWGVMGVTAEAVGLQRPQSPTCSALSRIRSYSGPVSRSPGKQRWTGQWKQASPVLRLRADGLTK